jgi:pimeloyl-ACP methyl ester carboxylesterase
MMGMGRCPKIVGSIVVAFALASVSSQMAASQSILPAAFKAQTIHSPAGGPGGADIFVRSAGTGPVVVLIHGYAETSDSWAPLAAELVKTYTVIVPDLRGIGSSSRPAGGYDKKTQAADIRAVVTTLGFDRTFVVSHDIGIMVARPGAMHSGFAHFKAFAQDVEDNQIFQRTKLTMPVLAVGGEKSFGATEAVVMRNVAVNVREAVVPNSGHWLMEESPAYTVALIRDYLKDPLPATR